MQISDLLGYYGNSAGKEALTGTKGVERLVSGLREMSAGNIFEGTVNSVKNGQVVLGLSNGQEVTARMEGKVAVTVGQSMFFQVKSNDGSMIAIRPFTMAGNSVNLTLLDALKAAALPVDAKNLSMVNTMMEEQMSVDRNSLMQMARLIQNHPDIDVRTLVQLQKLHLPITPEFASQFENYLDDKQAIGKALEDFMLELPSALSNEELPIGSLRQMGAQILSILTEGLPEENAADMGNAQTENGVAPENNTQINDAGKNGAQELSEAGQKTGAVRLSEGAKQGAAGLSGGAQGAAGSFEGAQDAAGLSRNTQQAVPHTLAAILGKEGVSSLTEQLASVMKDIESSLWFAGNTLDPKQSAVAVLNELQRQLAGRMVTDKGALLKLFSGKEFQALVKDAMEQQWMIRPEELSKGEQMRSLYDHLENQLDRMENVMKASGQVSENITQLAAEIHSNIDFMNQVNQTYTYVQIPLKMSGQNASGELYVYTKKKDLKENSGDLTAFLHLDMDHLGSTDVSVRMHGREIATKFYFDDDESFSLVEKHLPELERRLAEKGYRCTLSVANEGKKVNFVEDFLKKDQPSAGLLHRYSFDMRA